MVVLPTTAEAVAKWLSGFVKTRKAKSRQMVHVQELLDTLALARPLGHAAVNSITVEAILITVRRRRVYLVSAIVAWLQTIRAHLTRPSTIQSQHLFRLASFLY